MPPPNPELYFVRADDSDGENKDLLVVAANKVHAQKIWEAYFDVDNSSEPAPTYIGVVPGVTPSREAGPISWSDINPG